MDHLTTFTEKLLHDQLQLHGAQLTYNATYDLYYYENGAVITLYEDYQYSEPFGTETVQGSTVLNVTTTQGIQEKLNLGVFETKEGHRTQDIAFYGLDNLPTNLFIKVNFWISNTWRLSAPLVPYTFFYQP
jgi:hypothetical protein